MYFATQADDPQSLEVAGSLRMRKLSREAQLQDQTAREPECLFREILVGVDPQTVAPAVAALAAVPPTVPPVHDWRPLDAGARHAKEFVLMVRPCLAHVAFPGGVVAWRGACLQQARAMCSTLIPTGLFQLAAAIHQTRHWDAALHPVGANGGPAIGNLSFLARANGLGATAQAALFALGCGHDSASDWKDSTDRFLRYILSSPCAVTTLRIHVVPARQVPAAAWTPGYHEDRSHLARVLQAADGMPGLPAQNRAQWVAQALNYVRQHQRVWFNSATNRNNLAQLLSARWDAMNEKKHTMHPKTHDLEWNLLGWQKTIFDAIEWVRADMDRAERFAILVNGHPRCGKDTFINKCLKNPAYLQSKGVQPYTVADLTDFVHSKRSLASAYNGEDLVIVNYQEHMLKRLSKKSCDEEVGVLEVCTDPGKEVGALYYGVHVCKMKCLLVIFANESFTETKCPHRPRGALLNKCVAEVNVHCEVGHENDWRAEDPQHVRWHFHGEPPHGRLPGFLGHVERPLVGGHAHVDGRAAILEQWRADSAPTWAALQAAGIPVVGPPAGICSPADLATVTGLLAVQPAAVQASFEAVFRRLYQMGINGDM